MPKVRVYHDGWIALPMAVRKKLGLELVGGAVVLHPAGAVDVAEPPVVAERPRVSAADTASSVSAAPAMKRGRGRPRKIPAVAVTPEAAPSQRGPAAVAAPQPAPPAKRGPGRPRKALTAAAALPKTFKARGRRAALPAAE